MHELLKEDTLVVLTDEFCNIKEIQVKDLLPNAFTLEG